MCNLERNADGSYPDLIEANIEGIGTLRNPVIADA